MARVEEPKVSAVGSTGLALPVDELRGMSVWSDAGEEIGRIRGLRTTDDGRIVALEVQHGWMFGHRFSVDAGAMRMEEGSVIVPAAAVHRVLPAPPATHAEASVAGRGADLGSGTVPTLIAGRLGARMRFGGVRAAAGIVGALAAFASAVMLSGLMTAIFSSVHTVTFDASFSSWSDLWTRSTFGGAVVLAIAMVIGGWAAGRVSRFDGMANGMSVTAWLIALGAIAAGLGAWIGDSANVFDTANVPHIAWSDLGGWAIVGMAISVVIMLVCGALGGALGSWYNRRVDHSMLRHVPTGGSAADSSRVR